LYHTSYDPDKFILPEDLYCPYGSTIVPDDSKSILESDYSTHCSTKSIRLLLDWQNTTSSAKTNEEIYHLVYTVLLHPEFQLDTLESFNATQENRKADTSKKESPFYILSSVPTLELKFHLAVRKSPTKHLWYLAYTIARSSC
jgi:hypothetical protein